MRQSAGRGLARKNSRAKGLGKGLSSLGDAEEADTRRGSSEREGILERRAPGDSSPGRASASFPAGAPFLPQRRRGLRPGLRPGSARPAPGFGAGRGKLEGEGHDGGGTPWWAGLRAREGRRFGDTRHRTLEGRAAPRLRLPPRGLPSPPASFSVSKLTIENAAA